MSVVRCQVFCPILNECKRIANEVSRWDCINLYLFQPTPRSPSKHKYVEYNCGGVGWGNSIRAYYTGVSMAVTTGRKLIVVYPAFNRNFLPPNESVSAWDFNFKYSASDMSQFDYAVHGQFPGRYAKWSEMVKNGSSPYQSKVLAAGLCGGDGEFLSTGGCMDALLPSFTSCAREDQVSMNIPFYYYLFRRPGPLIEEALTAIRAKLDLPPPLPGDVHRGLRSEGYYQLGLHFRRIPLGFEPEAVNLNADKQLDLRLSALAGFWQRAVVAARQAKRLARCRKEQLIIYFASDDVGLRSKALELLSSIGRVVFGLEDNEVGHVSPHWSERHFTDLETDAKAKGVSLSDVKAVKAKMRQSRSRATVMADMSMVEWWVLSHSHWLVSGGYTSFSTSAGGVGFGPTGALERLDVVYSPGQVSTIYRRDFSRSGCPHVGAVSRKHAKKCPNGPHLSAEEEDDDGDDDDDDEL